MKRLIVCVPTPSQTVGPFFSIGLCPNLPNNLVPPERSVSAQLVTVRGRVLDGEDEGVPDGILEIWRADENGCYAGWTTSAAYNAQGTLSGFARVPTNERGEFEFQTIRPGLVNLEGNEFYAPHLEILVFMRGLLRHLLTRMYFPQEAANDHDRVLKAVPAERRGTLIAATDMEREGHFLWNIRLQGGMETVFFES